MFCPDRTCIHVVVVVDVVFVVVDFYIALLSAFEPTHLARM